MINIHLNQHHPSFDINNNFKLKPHAFVKYALDTPISVDINTNLFNPSLI